MSTASVDERSTLADEGERVNNISLSIDYEIIEHFSENLYSSPNKAVEELVANGFDAGAEEVRVYIPERYSASDNVIVWDDGNSMDEEGLQQLWLIATSPKKDGDREITGPDGTSRRMIGKFGIGKLASYTLGDSIAHLCKVDGRFLYAKIKYGDVLDSVPSQQRLANSSQPTDGSGSDGPGDYEAPVYEVGEDAALEWVKSKFRELPDSFPTQFQKETWTLALISNLKEELSVGRLKWVLGNGMPTRPDFRTFVDEDRVESRFVREDLLDQWKIGDDRSRNKILSTWEEAKSDGNVAGELAFGRDSGVDPEKPEEEIPYVEFPNLGRVWGEVALHDRSLQETRASEMERSHGFFVMVRGRLINPDDPSFLIEPPQFGTFNRSKYVVNADKLDEDLLASREELNRNSVRVEEFKVVSRALYRLTRSRWDEINTSESDDDSITTWIPTDSEKYYRSPLLNLAMKKGIGIEKLNIERPDVKFESLGDENSISDVDEDGFSINDSHPYLKRLKEQHNLTDRRGKQILREFELISISEKLFEGFLSGMGIRDNVIEAILSWRDGLFRQLSRISTRSFSKLQQKVEDTSYTGGDVFEEAIGKLLRAIGFRTEIRGGNADIDGLITVPREGNPFRISIEAKGRSDEFGEPVVARVNTHRDDANAHHAVIIARDFQGFEQKDEPQLLKDCINVDGKVSLMEVEALVELADVMDQFSYSTNDARIIDVLTSVESTSKKMNRIAQLRDPLDVFPYDDFLETAWEMQNQPGVSEGTPQPLRNFDDHLEFVREKYFASEDDVPSIDKLVDKLYEKVRAIRDITDEKNVILNPDNETVLLHARPEAIINDVDSHLRASTD